MLKLRALLGIGAWGCVSCSSPDQGQRAISGGTAGDDAVTAGSGGDLGTGGGSGDAGLLGSGGSPIATGTDGGPACPAFTVPAIALLETNQRLPDPFRFMNGTRVTSKDQWACRRAEIASLVQELELGPKPGKPEMVSGTLDGNSLTVTSANAGKMASFTATITLPATGTAPYPAMIAVGGSSLDNAELAKLGVAMITFPNNDVGAQVGPASRGMGKFYEIYGSDHKAGAMMAWAWGVSRMIDVLEETPAAQIDPKRLGVTGCSRNGKGALVVGAFDERIALTVAQESGSGGSASWRVSDAQSRAGQNVQTLGEIVGENVWFTDSFKRFGGIATDLPFDHHTVEGLVAPRALLVIENTSMEWLGNVSTFTASTAGHMIWEGLGIPDKMAFSQIGGHNHCLFPAAQQQLVTAYVNKFLVGGGTAKTNVIETDGTFTFDKAKWVDWEVPALP